MQITIENHGYVTSYALIGGLENGIEVADPEDEAWFAEHFEGCRYDGSKLVYDEEHMNEVLEQRNAPVIDAVTELQLALAEVYELLEGGRS